MGLSGRFFLNRKKFYACLFYWMRLFGTELCCFCSYDLLIVLNNKAV